MATYEPDDERELRRRLGIPADARRVLILAESSHWDPNWLRTSEGYFAAYVRPNLDRALAELAREPRRIYSVECTFFLRRYWEARPERREQLRDLINSGRLRLTNSGVTTADTLLPDTEAILRDFLLGQEWLRAHGMAQEPSVAYFPDSFGASPALPSLLNAAGFRAAALTRIDGMRFVGTDCGPPSRYNWPGSSAHRLLVQERSFDFVWRDLEGGEVLCHWNACTYGQGDLLAYAGLARVKVLPIALPDRRDRHVACRIAQYVAELGPYSRTPYLFCPMGFDFVGPTPDLLALLDRYNATHYPRTGVWAANAGLDDYLALVACQRGRLPALALDPNPYWTGFYSARPNLKQACHTALDGLRLAEALAVAAGQHGTGADAGNEITARLAPAWWRTVAGNHHDFITGTSPDHVVQAEQGPWLAQAAADAAAAAESLGLDAWPQARAAAGAGRAELPAWRAGHGLVEIETPEMTLTFAEEAGGCLVRAADPAGRALLAGPSFDLVSYLDSGGLWRMGMEFAGGAWREVAAASQRPAAIAVRELADALELTSVAVVDGMRLTRRIWLRSGEPAIFVQVRGATADKRTVTMRIETGQVTDSLAMDQPGGVVSRPPEHGYEPTFWPLQSCLHLPDGHGRGVMLSLGLPGAVSYRRDGRLEVIAGRNAPQERAYGLFTLRAHPAKGHDWAAYTAGFGISFLAGDALRPHELLPLARRIANNVSEARAARARFDATTAALLDVGPSDISVIALKPAQRGAGVILRLYGPGCRGRAVRLAWAGAALRAAYLCDARERDLQSLAITQDAVSFTMPGSLATVRLLTAATTGDGQ